MPRKPSWYNDLDAIIDALERHPRPFVDRATIEELLGVGRRRAQQIMAACTTDRIGANALADRGELITHLQQLAAGEEASYERRRRQKVACAIDEFRRNRMERPHLLVEAPARVVYQEFRDLPAGIELAPGSITIRFYQPEEALQKLLALAMAIGNDRDRFDRLTALS